VSALTLSQLLATNPEVFTAAAEGWERLADGIDRAAEDFINGTRDLADAWPLGPASQAAHNTTAELRAELNAAYNPARRIFEALRHHAAAAHDLRAQAEDLVEHAERSGYQVDPAAGTVTAKPGMVGTADSITRFAQSVADGLAAILARARALDDSTANAITVNLPDPQRGFGNVSMSAITQHDLEGQRGQSPADVNRWWQNLTPEQRAQAIRDCPQLVGWLDGVPAEDRNVANRAVLAADMAGVRQRQHDLQARIDQLAAGPHNRGTAHVLQGLRAQLADVNEDLGRLDRVQRTLDELGPKGYLLGIDPAGDGKALVSVGNPDLARHTAVWVPGLGTTLDSTRGNVQRVLHLQEAADRLTLQPNDVSTVMWLGYDAPEVDTSVITSERSRAGAGPLSQFIGGLRATHEGSDYHVTAVGHSYGSTVVGEAALRGGFAVDDIVTAGSPGMHTDRASNLHIDPAHVWAGSAPDDPVSNPGGHAGWVQAGAAVAFGPAGVVAAPLLPALEDHSHGPSPQYPSFGANWYVTDTSGHSAYWDPGSKSILNQADIVVGQYGLVGLNHGQRPPDITP
jgi:hypothetical protein